MEENDDESYGVFGDVHRMVVPGKTRVYTSVRRVFENMCNTITNTILQPQLIAPLYRVAICLSPYSSPKMSQYTNSMLIAALNAVSNGQSIRSASKDYGIPRSTL